MEQLADPIWWSFRRPIPRMTIYPFISPTRLTSPSLWRNGEMTIVDTLRAHGVGSSWNGPDKYVARQCSVSYNLRRQTLAGCTAARLTPRARSCDAAWIDLGCYHRPRPNRPRTCNFGVELTAIPAVAYIPELATAFERWTALKFSDQIVGVPRSARRGAPLERPSFDIAALPRQS